MTAENRIKGLVEIRDSVRRLIDYQTNDYPDEVIRKEQEQLNRLYDTFTGKYGLINNRGNYLAFASDEAIFCYVPLKCLTMMGNLSGKRICSRNGQSNRTVLQLLWKPQAKPLPFLLEKKPVLI